MGTVEGKNTNHWANRKGLTKSVKNRFDVSEPTYPMSWFTVPVNLCVMYMCKRMNKTVEWLLQATMQTTVVGH